MHNWTAFHDGTEYQTDRSEFVDRAQRLLEERNVTRAADRLGLTQSAASRMLGRLRATFDDPLFVRTSRGLTPTKRALDIAGPLREYLAGLEKLLVEGEAFDPGPRSGDFASLPSTMCRRPCSHRWLPNCRQQAPLIDFEIRQPSSDSERDLDAGVLDLLLMPQQPSAPGVVWTPLYRDGYTCVVWSRHPSHRLTLSAFAAMEHVLVAPRERAGGIVDAVLEKNGLSRRVAVQASTFLIVPYLLIGTTRIATVPSVWRRTRAHPSLKDPQTAGGNSRFYHVPSLARDPSKRPRPPLVARSVDSSGQRID